jgi:hypothetical protein
MGSVQVKPPPGFELDKLPDLPPGFTLDSGEENKPKIATAPAEPVEKPGFNPLGFPEAALALATPVVGRGVGLLAGGLGAMLPGKDGQAERWLKGTQEALSYSPRSQTGKDIIGEVGQAAKWIADRPMVKSANEGIEAIGEKSPVAGAAIASIPDLVGVLGARAPLQSASNSVKSGASNLAQSVAERAMNSALKPILKAHKSGDAAVAVDTALKYGINPTKAGVEKLKNLIDETNQKISTAIEGSTATVSRDAATSRVGPVMKRFADQVAPEADIGAVNSVLDQFGRRPENLTVQQAQSLKQGTYKKLEKAYNGELGTASIDAQKAIARGLKEEIATAVPEISGLNALDSQLYKTLDVLERRTLMEMNKNSLGLSVLAHSPMTWAIYMADHSATFKAIAARMLNKISGQGVKPTEVPIPKKAPFNPSLGYGLDTSPVPSGAAKPNPLGDLTPDWETSLGAGTPKPPSMDASGLFPAIGDERVGTIRLKSRPQMPIQSGLLGVDDVAVSGRNWTDAAPGAIGRVSAAPMAVGGIELSKIVNMPKSSHRTRLLNDFKKRYPNAAQYIDEVAMKETQ